MEQEKIDVMWALTVWRHVINRVAIVFGIGRNNIYANFRVLVFQFGKITQLDREGNALKIEGSLVINVTGHALDVMGLRRIQRRQDGPFEAAIIVKVLDENHCVLLGDIRGCRDVTTTCKRAKFGDNKHKLENKVNHEAAPARIELFDASKKMAQKLVDVKLVSSGTICRCDEKCPSTDCTPSGVSREKCADDRAKNSNGTGKNNSGANPLSIRALS